MTKGADTTSSTGGPGLPSPKERRRLREAADLTYEEVAAAVGVTPATVRSWESGRTKPRGRKREAYINVLNPVAAAESRSGEDRSDAAPAPPAGSAPHTTGVVRVFGAALHGRPAGPRTRPRIAVKRAARPPFTLPRHESRSPVAAGAGGHAPLPPADGPTPEPSAPEPSAPEPPAPEAEAAPAADPDTTPDKPSPPAPAADLTPAQAFDALHAYAAPALARQAYLLTGRRSLSLEAVERAFQEAWSRWPAVATDPDPVGWVRAASHEYALSPWHLMRRFHRHPDKAPADPTDRIVMDAMLALPSVHRRTVLLYDGVGLDLPDTAAETESTTPTAGHRLLRAHASLAQRMPELDGLPPAEQSALLRARLGSVRPAVSLETRTAASVRATCERRARGLTRAAMSLTAVIAVATAYTAATAPTQYEPPIAPGTSVSGVPPAAGPPRLTEQSKELHDKLRADPAAGPARLAPKVE